MEGLLAMFSDPAYWESLSRVIPEALYETLYMVIVSTILAYVLGVPMGVLLVITSEGHIIPNPWVERILGTIINIFRSIPFIILLVALIPFTTMLVGTSIGTTAAIVPLVVSAAPFVARLVESSLREVSSGVIEAALSMGASPWQIIYKVLLPEAKSPLILGIAITTINIIAYTAMAGAVGGGGLGDVAIQYGYNRYRTDMMIITVLILVVIVQLIQWIGTTLAKKLSHR
ncbi:MAG: ABC transporter permease [Peptococcaceae bacterium]|jgi:D-methionine transport system permease protein|nr:ABC transporter permease [Peptococcaceae bacterium]